MRKSMLLVVGLVLAITATALARTGEPLGAPDEIAAGETELGRLVSYGSSKDGKSPTTTTAAGVEFETDATTTATTEGREDRVESTTTAPVDVTADLNPPLLQILHPTDGQVFEAKEVVFEGVTEPGAAVFAGDYQAEVGDDGGWRIVLFLFPGSNVVTFHAKDSAGNVAEAVVKPILEIYEEEKKDETNEEEEKKEEETPDVGFSASQVYGECSETPPYDVFWGTGQPGTVINVKSEFGTAATEINQDGHWEVKVFFEGSIVGKTFPVYVKDAFGNVSTFEFTRTG